jgi:GDP-L-fucose synthase
MNKTSRIFVTGHTGLVGSAIFRKLVGDGYDNVIGYTHKALDLTHQMPVDMVFHKEKPDYVFHCAARVGGIVANSTQQAQFLYDNLAMSANVIHASYEHGVKRLLNFGSVCMYPRNAEVPIIEESICTGSFEPTNEGYAVAKVAAAKMCQMYNKQYDTTFCTLVPCNLFGVNDNFDPVTAHVLPAMIRKFHEAKTKQLPYMTLLGTGDPIRELMYVDDLAEVAIRLMLVPMIKEYTWDQGMRCIYNCGSGRVVSIHQLAVMVRNVVGYYGELRWDTSYPDGAPHRQMHTGRLNSILEPKELTSLEEGIAKTYKWALDNNQL